MFKNLGKRLLYRLVISIIAFAVVGVGFVIKANTGEGKIARLLDKDYYNSYVAYMECLADLDMENAEKNLVKCTKAVDKIADVSISNKTAESAIDDLAWKEKKYLNDMYRCFTVLDDPDNASEAELQWAEKFISTSDHSSASFYTAVFDLIE